MSRENVEVARRLYPDRLDIAAVFANPTGLSANRRALEPYVDPDFETIADPKSLPMAGSPADRPEGSSSWGVRGVDGFVSVWQDWLSGWDAWVVTPHDFVDVDDERVLVLFEMRGRPKGQKAEIPVEGANLLTFRARKLIRLELFFNKADALEAAGLREQTGP